MLHTKQVMRVTAAARRLSRLLSSCGGMTHMPSSKLMQKQKMKLKKQPLLSEQSDVLLLAA